MKKLFAILALLTFLPVAGLAAGGSDFRAPAGLSGTDPFDWSLTRGVKSGIEGSRVISYTQIGHFEGEARLWVPNRACIDLDAAIHMVELSAVSQEAMGEFWEQMAVGNQCRYFSMGLKFWADVVVMELPWGDGTPMYIMQGHDNMDVTVYTWIPVSAAREVGLPTLPPSETP